MKNKLRVAVLIDAWYPFKGGAQVHVDNLTNRLSKHIEFVVFHAHKVHLLHRILWALYVTVQVYLSHRRRPYNLIHAHAFLAGLPALILSKTLKIPVIFTVHGSHSMDLWNSPQKRVLSRIKYLIEKWLLTQIQYTKQISVSKRFLDYQNINRNIRVIPNGVEISLFDRLKLNKRKQFTIIYIGNNQYIKGYSILIIAMKKVKIKYKQVKLITIKGATTNHAEIIRLLKQSHLFVLPSLAEGQPISLLEAWAAKLPVIATNVGDNSRYVKEGINGFLIPPGDSKILADTIIKAIEKPDLANLGLAGYNLVKKKYSWKIAAESTLKVYKEVVYGAR
jgi:glycosyltransferase involved in cell wall biosynthesis